MFKKMFGPSFDELAREEIRLQRKYTQKHSENVDINIDNLEFDDIMKQDQKISNFNKFIKKATTYSLILLCFLLVFLTAFEIYKNFVYDKYSIGISLDEFNRIENGMTYEEVVNIIGHNGAMQSSLDLNIGSEYATESYLWDGTDSLSSAIIIFQGGKVIMKSQFNLE